MDRELADRVYKELRISAASANMGAYQGAGDFENVGFAFGAAYPPQGSADWAVCGITLKSGFRSGRHRQVYFKWKDYPDNPSTLADGIVEQYQRFERGEPRDPAWDVSDNGLG